MWQQLRANISWLLPAVVLGLFFGRVGSESWFFLVNQPPGWPGVVLISLVGLGVATAVSRQWSVIRYPALLLVGYVLYPALDLAVAGLVAAVSATAVCQQVVDGQIIRSRRQWRLLPGLLVAAAAFTLYTLTLSPGILPADNGEFQLVAARLGVAHPPGFPLYTMLAHLMTRLPLATTAAYKVNLFAAVTGALTLWVVYRTVMTLTQKHLAATTAVIALGSATTFWAQATMANIRSLTALFAALMLFALVRFWQTSDALKDRYLITFALAAGFGIVHHPSLIFIGVICIIFIVVTDRAILRAPRRWIRPLLAGLLGLLPLLYLPLRANSGAPGATPDLATWHGFLDHVLARGFSGDFFYYTTPELLWQRLQVMGNVMTFQFNGVLLLGMLLGILLLAWRAPRLALLLGGGFALHTLITATYRAPQTVEYMLPAYVPAVITLGYGLGRLPLPTWQFARTWLPLQYVIIALFFVSAVWQGVHYYPSFALLHQSDDARAYGEMLLAQAPADAVILADWHWFSPLRLLQQLEGQRPDVAIHFVPPGEGPYGETWAARIDEELANGRSVVATHFDAQAYADLPPPQPIGEAFLFPRSPRRALPDGFLPLDVPLSEQVHLLGYHLVPQTVTAGETAVFTVAWEATAAEPTPLFVHLVGIEGALYAQDDLLVRPQPSGITLTHFRLTPRPGAQPGAFAVYVGQATQREQLTTLTIEPSPQPPVTLNRVQRPLLNTADNQQLVGYDWDQTLPDRRLYLHWHTDGGYRTQVLDNPTLDTLPPYVGVWGVVRRQWRDLAAPDAAHYVPFGQGIVWTGGGLPSSSVTPGETLTMWPRFRAGRPVQRDLAISVRLIGFQQESDLWAWTDLDDSIPALGAIPTLKWIAGSRVASPHTVTVSEDAFAGQQVGATLRLYDAFTNRPVPILDERITAAFPWVPLGTGSVNGER